MDNNTVIIGGGIFGLTTAIILAENGNKVILLERNYDLLKKASLVNQNRIHYGYHYPRSIETGSESIKGMNDFLDYYGDCINDSYPKFYAISKKNSLISSDDFKIFTKKLNIPLENAWPEKNKLNRNLIEECWRVYEPSFDYMTLRINILKRIEKLKNITIYRNVDIQDIKINESGIDVKVFNNHIIKAKYLVNATYSDLGNILKMSLNEDIKSKFQLLVLPILRTNDIKSNYGITIMDGPFCSIVPRGFSKNEYILSNVKGSVIENFEGTKKPKWKFFNGNIENKIINKSSKYFPNIKQMDCIDSWITTKMILPNKEKNDARPTLVIKNHKKIFSVFSGKITTCVSAAKQILNYIKES